ncbi:hypothetical protein TNCV_4079421 [Trichonephila clavipes]|nr:hypothetical protein TNCV_4079421 [Trichonephila clavipes]
MCRSFLKDFPHNISFQWIPAHYSIAGNELANFLTKKGALVIQRPAKISTFNSLRLLTNMPFKHDFKKQVAEMSKYKNWTILNKDPSWLPGAPRKAAVTDFRLLTGHVCLNLHLYRIGIANSPDCTLYDSDQPMTAEHLVVCPALTNLNSIVEKYWRHLALMAQVLL